MSGNGQNEQEGGKEDGEAGRDMYRPKSISTVVRVLTVFAYLFSVSLAAILLSVYYVCVWKSPELPPLQNARIELEARRGEPHEYQNINITEDSMPFDYPGRSNITVNGNATDTVPSNLLEPTYESTREPSTLELSANLTIETMEIQQTTHDNITSFDIGTNDTNTNT